GAEASEGPRPLATRAYYARLTQALLAALTAPTANGRLYQVDMRLRPSGRQGPVATSIGALSDYQLNEAWTWEHLALTRARVVAVIPGSVTEDLPPLSLRIEALRHEILTRRGTDPRVMPDFQQMRARIFGAMEENTALARRSGRGRLQDIELF